MIHGFKYKNLTISKACGQVWWLGVITVSAHMQNIFLYKLTKHTSFVRRGLTGSRRRTSWRVNPGQVPLLVPLCSQVARNT